ncbi:MAG: tRNA pseudouridine(55) synthase TruB [Henriciella sp.]|nr:tRNA pseudouridine(55) synthase TruB [Henriciella sp.]
MGRQRKRKGDPVHGWLAVDKPVDVSSTRVVGILKRLYNAQKAGHGGTLDPLADGILPIAFGEATKTAQWAMDCDKEYVFTIEWGNSTASQDKEGEVVATSDVRPTREQIEAALPDFIGDIQQVPPKYSAIKVDGERAYDLARDGEAFEIPSREVTVYEAELVNMADADHATFRVVSGKGFYIRALARDLAIALGAEGHVSQLRRTRVGAMDASNSITLAALENLAEDKDALLGKLLPLETVLDDVPQIEIDASDAAALKQGREIVLLPHLVEQWRSDAERFDSDRLALTQNDSKAVALGEVRAGRFQPKKVFQL